jgi:DNA primase
MARIPQDEIDRIKAEVSVQRLAEGKGIELRPHGGGNLIGRCPFHDDRTPSLVITLGKNLWHCLGACQAGGSPIDWVMRAEGVSFRHAVEILREMSGRGPDAPAGAVAPRPGGRLLPPPVAAEADDAAALAQVADYYAETLKRTPAALAYLQKRGIDHPEALGTFRIGFADRSLGLRLPPKQIKAGAEMRGKLQRLGVMRESGHEHFTGSIVFPLLGGAGEITGMYGRKINDDLRPGTAYHLYLPGPHRGLWNPAAFTGGGGELIVCEAIIDALTFWCAGFRNVTAAYGVEGFTPDHWAALRTAQVHTVFIAYDRDEAGNTAAAKLADELMAAGIAAYRVQFPPGMDANEYARKVTPPDKSLGVALRGALWLGRGPAPARHLGAPATPAPADAGEAAAVVESTVIADVPAPAPAPAPVAAAAADLQPLAAPAAAAAPPPTAVAAPIPAPPAAAGPAAPAVERRGEDVVLMLGEREYRVRGLGKNLAFDVLRINLRVRVGDAYHIDTLDLYQAKARTVFINAAAEATQQKPETIAKDIGRLLLALEEAQEKQITEALKPKGPQVPEIPDDEAAAALAWLKAPDLLGRILGDFATCGVVGEEINKLACYVAAVSRKLDEPLAILIQSSSAAGKSSLMEAVLALIPEEERVQYSAMTGQSLYYMGDANLAHKVLAIAEEEGASRASYALKLLQSEGRLTIASTGKDPQSGRLVTHDYTVEGPVMIFMTTTAVDIDEELMNRCIVLTVDEGAAQTHAIHQVQRTRQTLAGQLTKRDRDHIRKLHQNAQRLLRSLLVVNPYAERLTFLHHRTRLRRDHVKYLTLIRSVALLHQHQRPVLTTQHHGNPVPYIEVTPDDIAVANRIAHAVLGRSLDELSPPTRRFLMDVHGLVVETAKRKQIDRADVRLTRREIREATGWTMTQVGVHLGRLVELEYVLQYQGGRGLQAVYELAYDGEGQDGTSFLPGLVDPATLSVPSYDANLSASTINLSESKRPQNGGVSVGYRSAVSCDSYGKNQSTDQEEATKYKISTLPGVCAESLGRNHNAAAVAV